MYDGVGRILQGHARQHNFFAWVEPIPGKTDGVYRCSDPNNDETIHYINMPSLNVDDDESLSVTMKELLAQPRRKRDGNTPKLELGSEAMGTYIAPDGRLYVGVGKVTAVGRTPTGAIYALVNPIPGRVGGDYDFYDQLTFEYMPDFTGHTAHKSRFPARDHFSRTIEELAPDLNGSGLRAWLPF
ncbi:hypothetical protein BJX66DRAFT_335166 [Aspergillus keveii]|uniref:Uncharacterized protein n=1 Tax=Aspergillus keveii TaxID=714993 RepID=A0ABR4GDZ9_9EURO